MKIQTLDELEKSLRDADSQVYLILGPEVYQCQLALDLVKRTVVAEVSHSHSCRPPGSLAAKAAGV